ADRGQVALRQQRQRGADLVGAVGPEQQVDLVDVQELAVDRHLVGGIGLVVVIDERDRTPEQAALGIDVVAPDLQRQQKLAAVRRIGAGEAEAQTDLDRIGGVRALRGETEDRGRGNGDEARCYAPGR